MLQPSPPILMLVFNRPRHTGRVLDVLRKIKPPVLYVAADGPRERHSEDAVKTAQVRNLFEQLDWECEVHTLYRDHNLGCRAAVKGAIDWFFEHEPEGIILEDDCVPDPSFFEYCRRLLERYRTDQHVMHIGGCNLLAPTNEHLIEISKSVDYFFTRQCMVYGWATWRRAWQHMDVDMSRLPDFIAQDRMKPYSSDPAARAYMLRKWQETHDKRNDSWAYAWAFTVFERGAYGILPTTNLVENIGHGEDATTTKGPEQRLARAKAQRMSFPMSHPAGKYINTDMAKDLFYAIHKPKPTLWLRYLLPTSWVATVGRLFNA